MVQDLQSIYVTENNVYNILNTISISYLPKEKESQKLVLLSQKEGGCGEGLVIWKVGLQK